MSPSEEVLIEKNGVNVKYFFHIPWRSGKDRVRALAVNFAENWRSSVRQLNYMWPMQRRYRGCRQTFRWRDSVASMNCDSQTLHPQHERPRLSSDWLKTAITTRYSDTQYAGCTLTRLLFALVVWRTKWLILAFVHIIYIYILWVISRFNCRGIRPTFCTFVLYVLSEMSVNCG